MTAEDPSEQQAPAVPTGTWRLVAAAAQGTAHVAEDLPCQDRTDFWVSEAGAGEVMVAAVADGAGSASMSDIGAATAVGAVLDFARQLADPTSTPEEGSRDRSQTSQGPESMVVPTVVSEAFRAARSAVEAAAAAANVGPKTMNTTLALALAVDDQFYIAQIGDGVIAVRHSSKGIIGPVEPHRGEFANETVFLTSGSSLPPIHCATFDAAEITGFGLSSDGLQLLITASSSLGTPHEPFFTQTFDAVQNGLSTAALQEFLDEVDERKGDDKSIVVGVRI